MPPTRRKAAPAANISLDDPNYLFKEVRSVDIKSIDPHPRNPRIGNIDAVADSLAKYSQYKPILVNSRNNQIVAGHHTWLAARRLGWDKIAAAFVDVDEDTHVRLMLVDNKTSDLGTYDEVELAKLLATLPDVTEVAYQPEEFLSLMDKLPDVAHVELGDVPTYDIRERKPDFDVATFGDEIDSQVEDDDLPARERIAQREAAAATKASESWALDEAAEELKGAFQLSDVFDFDKVGAMELPLLRHDRLMQPEDIPDKLRMWAGSATRDEEDPEVYWWYNYGIDSTSGMKDVSRMIPAFYCWDDYFDMWWAYPTRYVTKVLNTGIKYIVEPDWSPLTDNGLAFCLWQLYRNRFMARFFQEAGLKVLPNVSWPDGKTDFQREFVLGTYPPLRMAATQLQTFDPKEDNKSVKTEHQALIDALDLEVLILYAGDPGYDFYMNEINMRDTRLHRLPTRNMLLTEHQKGRKAKKTL